jgi:hypothetical protein
MLIKSKFLTSAIGYNVFVRIILSCCLTCVSSSRNTLIGVPSRAQMCVSLVTLSCERSYGWKEKLETLHLKYRIHVSTCAICLIFIAAVLLLRLARAYEGNVMFVHFIRTFEICLKIFCKFSVTYSLLLCMFSKIIIFGS